MNEIIFHQLADETIYAMSNDPDEYWDWPERVEISTDLFGPRGESEHGPIEKKDEVIVITTENGWAWYKILEEDEQAQLYECELARGVLSRPSDGKAKRIEEQEDQLRAKAEEIDIDIEDLDG